MAGGGWWWPCRSGRLDPQRRKLSTPTQIGKTGGRDGEGAEDGVRVGHACRGGELRGGRSEVEAEVAGAQRRGEKERRAG